MSIAHTTQSLEAQKRYRRGQIMNRNSFKIKEAASIERPFSWIHISTTKE